MLFLLWKQFLTEHLWYVLMFVQLEVIMGKEWCWQWLSQHPTWNHSPCVFEQELMRMLYHGSFPWQIFSKHQSGSVQSWDWTSWYSWTTDTKDLLNEFQHTLLIHINSSVFYITSWIWSLHVGNNIMFFFGKQVVVKIGEEYSQSLENLCDECCVEVHLIWTEEHCDCYHIGQSHWRRYGVLRRNLWEVENNVMKFMCVVEVFTLFQLILSNTSLAMFNFIILNLSVCFHVFLQSQGQHTCI